MNQKESLVDKMLAQLDSRRQSMAKQVSTIADIMDKSNNVLLQIEAKRTSKPTNVNITEQAAATPCTYTAEMFQTLARIIEQSQPLLSKSSADAAPESGLNFEEYLLSNRKRMEFLGNGVRKLLAVSDTVTNMVHNLQEDEGCFSDEGAEECESKEPSSE